MSDADPLAKAVTELARDLYLRPNKPSPSEKFDWDAIRMAVNKGDLIEFRMLTDPIVEMLTKAGLERRP